MKGLTLDSLKKMFDELSQNSKPPDYFIVGGRRAAEAFRHSSEFEEYKPNHFKRKK